MRNPPLRYRTIAMLLTFAGITPDVAWCVDPSLNPVRTDEVLGLSVSQGLKYDSNVFRLPGGSDNTATSDAGQHHDFVSVTSLRAGLDKQFGRHRLQLLAAPSIVRYAEFGQFDYVGQEFLADWSGRIGTDGRYGVNYERAKVATDPADQQIPTGNRATRDSIGADLAVPTGPRWQAVTTWRADRNRNSSDSEKGGDNDGWAADAGIRFQPATGNKVDLRYRRSRYDYPNIIPSQLADNTYTQDEMELSSTWQPTEPSRFEGRTSYVRRRHDNIAERDFSGWIGSLRFVWKPTVSTGAAVRVFRDIGAITDSSASYAKTYGISFQPTWAASAKLAFGSLLEWRRRSYNGFALESRAPERTAKLGLNARYNATRNWQFGFMVSDERRRSSDASHEYSDVISAVTAQWQM